MDLYQITYITRSEEESAGVREQIEKLEGKVISESSLGYRKFTYPIGKLQAGNYITFIFEMPRENIKKLDKSLKLDAEVIRFLITSRKKAKPTVEAPKEELKIEEREEMLPAPEETVEPTTKEATPEEPKEEPAKEKEETKKPRKTKVEKEDADDRLKKLEEKLDELLKE